MKTLTDKIALVTGASYGIGRAVAIGLARQGCDVVLTARTAEELERTADRVREAGRQAVVVPADILRKDDVMTLVRRIEETFGRLHILVHCASAPPEESFFDQLDWEAIGEIVDTTLTGPIRVSSVFMPLLEASGEGHIVTFSSDWAQEGSGGPPVFSAAKAGLKHSGDNENAKQRLLRRSIKLHTLILGDTASYDPGWEEPRYDIDDPIEVVRKDFEEAGVPFRIPLQEVVEAVLFMITFPGYIDRMRLRPAENPDYRYTAIEELG